jgi:hypothetical protein
VKATAKKRLIFALFSEVCLAFPVVDALKEGYEVTFLADMAGGRSQIAHISALHHPSWRDPELGPRPVCRTPTLESFISVAYAEAGPTRSHHRSARI